METVFIGQLFFLPKVLPPTPGSRDSGLTVAQFLSLNKEDKTISVVSVFNVPPTTNPGVYRMVCEVRPKKDKPGLNYWFRSLSGAEKLAA